MYLNMAEDKLIKYEQKQLQSIGKSIIITNKLLSESDRKIITELFSQNPKFFVETISWYYGLSLPQLPRVFAQAIVDLWHNQGQLPAQQLVAGYEHSKLQPKYQLSFFDFI